MRESCRRPILVKHEKINTIHHQNLRNISIVYPPSTHYPRWNWKHRNKRVVFPLQNVQPQRFRPFFFLPAFGIIPFQFSSQLPLLFLRHNSDVNTCYTIFWKRNLSSWCKVELYELCQNTFTTLFYFYFSFFFFSPHSTRSLYRIFLNTLPSCKKTFTLAYYSSILGSRNIGGWFFVRLSLFFFGHKKADMYEGFYFYFISFTPQATTAQREWGENYNFFIFIFLTQIAAYDNPKIICKCARFFQGL